MRRNQKVMCGKEIRISLRECGVMSKEFVRMYFKARVAFMVEGFMLIVYIKSERRFCAPCCLSYVESVSCIRWV